MLCMYVLASTINAHGTHVNKILYNCSDSQGQRNTVYFCGHTDISTEQGGTEYAIWWGLLKQSDLTEIVAQIIWGQDTAAFT